MSLTLIRKPVGSPLSLNYEWHIIQSGKTVSAWADRAEAVEEFKKLTEKWRGERMSWIREYQKKVNEWARERGIFEHSTLLAQCLKGISEAGEIADAIIKTDKEGLIDAIGDTLVCLCNAAGMINYPARVRAGKPHGHYPVDHLKGVLSALGTVATSQDSVELESWLQVGVDHLNALARSVELDLEECAEAAWNEIKDRKGRMVEGGAFVKEGDR